MLTACLVAAVLSQADAPAPTVTDPAERAALAAQKAAEAAAKAAEAAQRIADKVAPRTAEAAGGPAAPGSWLVNVGAGLSLLGGNTQSLTLTGNVGIDKKWEVWSLGIRLNGAYGLATPPGSAAGTDPSVVARRALGTVRGDRAFGGFVSAFALAGAEFDHIKSIESRVYGEGGASFGLLNEKEGDLEKLFLKLDLALRFGRETRFSYFPMPSAVSPYEIYILSPRVAAVGRWALNKNFKISEELEVLPFLLPPTLGRFLINSNTKINARITEGASLSLGFLLAIDTQPPKADLKPYDYTLTAGIDIAL